MAAMLYSENLGLLDIKILKHLFVWIPSESNRCATNENKLFATQWTEVRSGKVGAFRPSLVNKSTRLPVCLIFDKYSVNASNIASKKYETS